MENENKPTIEISYADGSCERTDPTDLFERADLLLHVYGLGGCKSFTEFVDMVNEEDPFIINGLLTAAEKRVAEQNGSKVSRSNNHYNKKSYIKKEKTNSPDNLALFLKEMGANRQEIDETLAKAKSGKIEVPMNDYSYITPEVLNDPDFDFKGTLKQMSEDRKKSINFTVSDATLKAKEKSMREKK